VKAKVAGLLKQMRRRARLEAGSHLRRAGELAKRYAYELLSGGLLTSWSSQKQSASFEAQIHQPKPYLVFYFLGERITVASNSLSEMM
jgi:hypothetical protein